MLSEKKEVGIFPFLRYILPSGFLGKPAVPVINEQLFNWIVGEPHHKDLCALWSVADSLSYVPKLDVHYKQLSPTIVWGEMRFILKNVASRILKRWNPKKDIFFEIPDTNS